MALADKLLNSVSKAFPAGDSAKGLEKIIMKLCVFVVKLMFIFEKFFYGKPIPRQRFLSKKLNIKNPLDLGIIPILRILASVDYCRILTYTLNKASLGKFDPFNPPPVDSPKLLRTKWNLQKKAFDVQMLIDNYEKDYLYANNRDSKNKLFRVIAVVKAELYPFLERAVIEAGTVYGTDEDQDALNVVYPQLQVLLRYLKNMFLSLDRYTDYRQITNQDFQKITRTIQRIRQIALLIQNLNTPLAFLSSLVVSGLLPGLADELKRLEKIIRPDRAIPLLKKMLDACRSLQRVCQIILNFIDLAQLIISIVIILIRVFKIIITFLKVLPIPNLFTVVGITNLFSDVLALIKEKGPSNFEKRLNQVLLFLSLVAMLLRIILPALNEIIRNLSKLISNLQSCANIDRGLVTDLALVRNQLQNSADLFYIFLKNKELNDIENGTYNPDIVPIDQILTNPGPLDDTGLSDSLGIDANGNVTARTTPSNNSATSADTNNFNAFISPTTIPIGGNPVVGGIGGTQIAAGNVPTASTFPTGGLATTQNIAQDALRNAVNNELKNKNQDVGVPPDLAAAIEHRLKERQELQPGKNITNPSTKMGEYTIEIITEEVVEKTFGLKRRYGVALNNRKEVVVQSSPTYASDSGIIIRQVQQLLLSKGLVKQSFSLYDPNEENTIKNATSYLYNKDINWKNYPGLSNRMRARLGIDSNGVRIPTNNITNPKSAINNKATSGGTFSGTGARSNQGIAGDPNANVQNTNVPASNVNNLSGITATQPGVSTQSSAGISATVQGDGTTEAIPGAATVSGIPNISTDANDSALNDLYLSDTLDLPFADPTGIPGANDYQMNNFESFNIPGLGMDNFLLDEFEVDPPDNEDENLGLGLNAFINKLKGGRKLRRKMRQIFAKKLAKFKSDLRASDPKGKYGSSVGSQVSAGSNKVASADENTANGTMTTTQQQTYQNNNVDLVTGEFAYVGVILSNGTFVATVQLRADDPELAKQKLIDKYDPAGTKNYSYTINPA